MIKVSLIIPVYNVEKYLRKCLDSAVGQTLQEYEIICVNDGSADESGDILREYAQRFSRIRVIEQENQGLSAARNTGIENADGEYICFLDSDDWLEPAALQELLEISEIEKADIVFFGGTTEFETQKLREEFENQYGTAYKRNYAETNAIPGKDMIMRQQEQGCYYPSACLQFIRRSFLIENAIGFEPGIYHEDNLFTFSECLRAERTFCVSDCYYHRLIRRDSIVSATKSWKHLYGYIRTAHAMLELLNKNRVESPYLEAFYQDIRRVVRGGQAVWRALPDAEKEQCRIKCSFQERSIYELLLVPNFASMRDLTAVKEKNLRLHEKLEETRTSLKRKNADLKKIKKSHAYRIGKVLSLPYISVKKLYKRICRHDSVSGTDEEWMAAQLSGRKEKIILLGTPVHGNVGDHLIAESERIFFNKHFPESRFIDCTMPFAKQYLPFIEKHVRGKDIICISGGGWLGTQWRHNEEFVRRVIGLFRENPIVILPQTVYYEQGEEEYAKKGAEIYAAHPRLLFCLRDQASYDYVVQHGFVNPEKAVLMPDFALLYPYESGPGNKRSKIKLCFRDDRERTVPDSCAEEAARAADLCGETETITTNETCQKISLRDRKAYIERKMKEIGEARLLITDRLHAMIIAELTRTPCLFTDNSSRKVSGVYEWIRQLEWIRPIEKDRTIKEQIEEMLKQSEESTPSPRPGFEEFESELSCRIKQLQCGEGKSICKK